VIIFIARPIPLTSNEFASGHMINVARRPDRLRGILRVDDSMD